MKARHHSAHALLLSVLSGLPVWSGATELRFSGFATAAGGATLDAGSEYRVEPTTGGTYDDEIRFDPESIMGLQAQAIINERLRATLQVVSKGGDDFNTSADWAYISYDILPQLTLNAGRYRLPTFYYSDSLDIGYSYYWIRPPVEVYRIFTSTLEGGNLYHSAFIDEVEITTQAWYGAIDTELSSDVFIDTTNNMGINTTLTWDWLKFRLVYNTVDINVIYTPPTPTAPIESKSDVVFMAAAFMADFEHLKWRSEYTYSDDKNNDITKAWYASVAYSIGNFMPHLTHAELEAREAPFPYDQTTDTIGVAWYFDQSVVFKLEYTDSETESAQPTTDAKLIAVALDLVF